MQTNLDRLSWKDFLMRHAWAPPRATPVALPHPALPMADWADCYVSEGPAGISAREAVDLMMSSNPEWIHRLLALRNRIVGVFGLHTAALRAGEGGFPILSEQADEVVMGLDDRHLDFRLVVRVVATGPGRQTVSVATLVQRHNLFGRAYLAAILPFHRLIAVRTLSGLDR